MQTRIVRAAQIEDEFSGWDGETLFVLTDGTFWIQNEYKYWYHYAYRPQVEIAEIGGRLYLGLTGSDQRVAVRQLYDVVESRIRGTFTGWHGNTQYTLANGQTWQQAQSKSVSKSASSPHVRIYDSGSGKVMQVAGTEVKVKRVYV